MTCIFCKIENENEISIAKYTSDKNIGICKVIRMELLNDTNFVEGDKIDLDEMILPENPDTTGSIFDKLDLYCVDFTAQMLSDLFVDFLSKFQNTRGKNVHQCQKVARKFKNPVQIEWIPHILFHKSNFYMIPGFGNLTTNFRSLELWYKQIDIANMHRVELQEYTMMLLTMFKTLLRIIDSHLSNAFRRNGTNKDLISKLKTLIHIHFNLANFYNDYATFVFDIIPNTDLSVTSNQTQLFELEYMIVHLKTSFQFSILNKNCYV